MIDFVECTFPEVSMTKYNPMLDGVRLFRDGPIVNLIESDSTEAEACVLEKAVDSAEIAVNKKQVTISQKTKSEIPSASGVLVQQEGGQLAATPHAVSSDDDEEDIALQGRLSSCVFESASFLEQATNTSLLDNDCNRESNEQENGSGLKLYQIRLQDLLHKQLDKTFAACFHESNHAELTERDDTDNESVGIRLFKNAPLVTSIETKDTSSKVEQIPYRRRKSLLRRRLHIAKSCLHTVAVDGATIISEAEEAAKKASVALDTAVMAAKAAANKEEERILMLKRIRGESWLPSLAP